MRPAASRLDPDAILVRRARRTLAVRFTATFALILLMVGAVAMVVVSRDQTAELAASVRQTAVTEEDVVDPPEGSWIFRLTDAGKLTATEDAPAGFPDRAALDRVRVAKVAEESRRDGYLVVTRRRGTVTVQVVGSLAAGDSERRSLFGALVLAELLGLSVAAVAGRLLARRATAPLGDALARQRRFVADAGHELRTPLAQLHTRVQLLDRDLRAGATADSIAPDVARLVAGTRELGEVVEDLLASSQLPSRTGAGVEVDLGVTAASVLAGFAGRARSQGVELALRPDPQQPSLVHGREAALRRVVTALVDNALSHTARGGHVTVELGSEGPPPGVVVLVVRDDGSGFAGADAERLFERFARGHDDQRRFGLGLALAREVVTGHGGTIIAAGPAGKGAVFTVRLPAAPAGAGAATNTLSAPESV